ncbi:MAG: T9SS type A sorting domain-containing protein [Bacteroidia bacterium]
MKKIVLIITLFVNSIFANAQWVETNVPVSKFIGINGGVYLSKDSVIVYTMGSAYLSTDGGYNFTLWPENKFGGAHFISKVAENKWRETSNGSGAINASNDNGNSWNSIYVTNGNDTLFKNFGIRISHFFDEMHGFVLGDKVNNCYQVLNTNDGGNTWQKLNCDSIKIPNYENLFFTFFETVYDYNGEVWFRPKSLGYGNKIIRVRNYGLQVDTIVIKEGKFVQSMTFEDAYNGIAILTDTGSNVLKYLYKTTDGGKTWNELTNNSSVTNPYGITSFKNKFNKTYYLIWGSDGLNYSTNGGDNWIEIDKLRHGKIYPLDENNMISLFNESGNDNNLRVFTGKILAVNQINNQKIQGLFPNPANNIINIDENATAYSIYNLTGILVSSNQVENNFEVNIESLKSGIYLIKIATKNDGFYQTKFVKE